MKRMLLIAGAFALALTSAACTSVASGVASLATEMSSSTPAQVNTYAEATAAAAIVTRTMDLAVNTGKLDKATLLELQKHNEGIHAAWLELKKANDAHQSLVYASFNAALASWRSYRTSVGIPEIKPTS